jgi:hypothetical protein
MHLYMTQFDGITVGMDAQSPAAFLALKKNITYGEVKSRGWSRPTKRRRVPAKYVAAAMGEAAWLVTELKAIETVSWEGSGDIYLVYDEPKEETP